MHSAPMPRFPRHAALLLIATALAAPQLAQARPHHARTAAHPAAREAALEARLQKLEGAVADLTAALQSARAEAAAAKAPVAVASNAAAAAQSQASAAASAAQAAQTAADAATRKLAAIEAKPQPEGMRVGSTNLRIGGFLKLETAVSRFNGGAPTTNTLGRDFYLPQTIPVTSPTTHPATTTDFTAKQTRLWLNLDTQVAGHTLKGYVETDFQVTASAAQNVTGGGSQKTTNGYTLALRRAYVQLDRWTFGQDWTTFQYVAALPESTDYVGATEGTVFVRQPQIRYSAPLGHGLTLHVAAENPESGTATVGSAALIENGTDHLPDFAAKLVLADKRGEIAVSALGRQVRSQAEGIAHTAGGYGGSVAGKLFLNADRTADLRFMATYGQNIGRYVGLNFAPDAVYVPASTSFTNVDTFAALAALRLPVSPTVRVNLIGSVQQVSYDQTLTLAEIGTYNHRAWSAAANLFYSPVKALDLGIEYRHGTRELVNGSEGQLDRVEFAAKYNF